jgi:hypothetical protein
MVDDVLLDGRSKVNVIVDGLKQKLGLAPPLPPPHNQPYSTYKWLISHLANHWELFPILGSKFMAYRT